MPEITQDTPRRRIQVGGVIFNAPTPYAAGHVLTENEAAALNQTFLENVGNNFRGKVTHAKKLAILGEDSPTPENLKSVTDDMVKEFDKQLDDASFAENFANQLSGDFEAHVTSYEMGARRSSSVEVVDPVTKEARSLAKDRLKKALQARGIKLNTVSADWYAREIDKLLDKENPKVQGERNITEEIWTAADRSVKLRRSVAEEAIDDLDFSGVEKEEEDTEDSSEE